MTQRELFRDLVILIKYLAINLGEENEQAYLSKIRLILFITNLSIQISKQESSLQSLYPTAINYIAKAKNTCIQKQEAYDLENFLENKPLKNTLPELNNENLIFKDLINLIRFLAENMSDDSEQDHLRKIRTISFITSSAIQISIKNPSLQSQFPTVINYLDRATHACVQNQETYDIKKSLASTCHYNANFELYGQDRLHKRSKDILMPEY